ncbi:hypothetical protein GYMLUDRAFT_236107 [Collybiopsis luxurians FD-317 M1]|nr:hypothetical protein GYMLUDRAFT_236107 [Collybiopsis luxurians FD-317 M1]
MASATAHSEEELKKWNVNQLKQFCKEKGIVGYSKLTKHLLVQKILSYLSSQHTNVVLEHASDSSILPSSNPQNDLNSPPVPPTAPDSAQEMAHISNSTQTDNHIVTLKRPAATEFDATTTSNSLSSPSKKLKRSERLVPSDGSERSSNSFDNVFTKSAAVISTVSVDTALSPSPGHPPPFSDAHDRPSTSSSYDIAVFVQDPGLNETLAEDSAGSPRISPASSRVLTISQAKRKKNLDEDPLAMNVRHNSVTCKACGKVVKYTMYDTSMWNRHEQRCRSNPRSIATLASYSHSQTQPTPSNVVVPTAPILENCVAESNLVKAHFNLSDTQNPPLTTVQAQRKEDLEADISGGQVVKVNGPISHKPLSPVSMTLNESQKQRRKVLEEDPLATNIQPSSVMCKACGKLVKFNMFDLSLWNRHKGRCKPVDSSASPVRRGAAASHAKGKRFAPLIINKKAKLTSPNPPQILTRTSKAYFTPIENQELTSAPVTSPTFSDVPMARKASSVPDITLGINSSSLSLYHLDFSVSNPITLDRISMPPSLAQRKQVARFAIILSQVAIRDLRACVLVSKMFRYAIYLSASARLARNFAGYRLSRILHRLPANMIDMWPYLQQREGESKYRRRMFEESFLGRAFMGRDAIAPRLWTSPDNDKQIVIAIRFLLTRLFFTVSVGGGENHQGWLDGIIVDAREIIKGEIWCIDVVQSLDSPSIAVDSFYVLEATCEVIGSAPLPLKAQNRGQNQLRADWSTYIGQKLSAEPPSSQPNHLDSARTSLLDQLSWTEEYAKGISKAWLKRIEIQQAVGIAKRTVAERYILASVVANSVSGQYKTSAEMANDFAGLPAVPVLSSKRTPTKLNLFLPAHHHVESVHFTTPRGKPLHPALAVIQTPAREYYVLRDNGMQVGCEEEGVGCIWMRIIGCAANGERA